MEKLTYDRNPTRQLALVANADYSSPCYVDLAQASGELEPIGNSFLREMHVSACGSVETLSENHDSGFVAAEWQVYGAILPNQ